MKIKHFTWVLYLILIVFPLSGAAKQLIPLHRNDLSFMLWEPSAERQSEESTFIKHRSWFALKTNVVFDLAATPNIEMELGLGRRFTLGVEAIFPWWKSESHNLTWQILAAHLTGKYWLQKKTVAYTGWHIGVFGGCGLYDIQLFNRNGEQGHMIDAGVEAGYTWALGKHLRLETAVYGGFLRSIYKSYDRVLNTSEGNIKVFRYPWMEKTRDWMGPTQAKVALVWWL